MTVNVEQTDENNTIVDYIGMEYGKKKHKNNKLFEMGGMTDHQLREFMTTDNEASAFLDKMIPTNLLYPEQTRDD